MAVETADREAGAVPRKEPVVPASARERMDYAIKIHREGKTAEALAIYREVAHDVRDHPRFWTLLGSALRSEGNIGAAVACQMRAVELDPESLDSFGNLQNALRSTGRYAEALDLADRCTARKYTEFHRQFDRARDLERLERYTEAIAAYDRAIELRPEREDLLFLRALAILGGGRFAAGLREYRHRWKYKDVTKPPRPSPEWDGSAQPGRSVAVIGEQGLGDFILTSRYLPRLAEMFGHVKLVLRRPLCRLYENLDHIDEVVERSEEKRRTEDTHLFTMDLLRHFDARPGNVPPPATLNVPVTARQRASKLLAGGERRLRIGIAWAGSPTYSNAAHRDVAVEHFITLAEVPGVQLYSLYKGAREGDLTTSGAIGLIDNIAASERDLADTAAVIDELDLVITTDTSIAHLSASLGQRTWCLLHMPAFWYWGSHGERTDWYPTMRLVRQTSIGDWTEVFARVRRDLKNLMDTETR